MTQLRVSSLELVEDGQPPLVRCIVLDAAGVRHEFVEKLPIVSNSATLPAHDAAAIRIFSDRELLAHHFPFHEATTELVINSTDAVFVIAEQIIIRGRCWWSRGSSSGAASP